MPYSRKNKSTRRPYRKARRFGRRLRSYRRRGFRYGGLKSTPLPMKMVVKMKYEQTVNLAPPVIGAPAVYVFRANSIYDPDMSGVGHQPRGHDQLVSMFDHYTVIGSKITAHFLPTHPTTDSNLFAGIAVTDSATTTTANNYIEGTRCRFKFIRQNTDLSGSTNQVVISQAINPNRFLGISKPGSSYYTRTNVGSNPNDSVYYHVFIEPLTNSTSSDIINVSIFMTFTVLLSEPKTPPIS